MRLLLLPKWARRIIVIPAFVFVFVWLLGLLPIWLVIAGVASRFAPGRWRALRLVWFLTIYMVLEVVSLVALFGLWIRAGFGTSIRSERSLARHHALMGWFLRRVLGSARRTFRLSFEIDDTQREGDAHRPLLVFSRHAGPGDSFLLVDGIVNGPNRRRPRIVLKDLLQLDPAIDVLLNRVGASFVPSGRPAGDAVLQEIERLAANAGPGDALVLFPEGANFTPRRRERAIEKLEGSGRQELADKARELTHLLPPKPTGTVAAIAAAPTATVLFVGHAGLEKMSTLGDIWRQLPMDNTIDVKVWRYTPDEVPPADEQESWLYEQWATIDAWITECHRARAVGSPA